jgi:hypothetical protein
MLSVTAQPADVSARLIATGVQYGLEQTVPPMRHVTPSVTRMFQERLAPVSDPARVNAPRALLWPIVTTKANVNATRAMMVQIANSTTVYATHAVVINVLDTVPTNASTAPREQCSTPTTSAFASSGGQGTIVQSTVEPVQKHVTDAPAQRTSTARTVSITRTTTEKAHAFVVTSGWAMTAHTASMPATQRALSVSTLSETSA